VRARKHGWRVNPGWIGCGVRCGAEDGRFVGRWPSTPRRARGGQARSFRVREQYFMRTSRRRRVESVSTSPPPSVAPGWSSGRRTGGRTRWRWKAVGSSSLLPPRAAVLVRLANRSVVPGAGSKLATVPCAVGGPESRSGGCARSPEEARGAGSGARIPRPPESSGAAGCRARSLSSER
jgi:hypothetical protein